MGGGASKKVVEVQDDAPPAAAGQSEAARVATKIQVHASQDKKKMKKDTKDLHKNHQKVNLDGAESDRAEGLYDSDLERQVLADAQTLEQQQVDVQQMKIAFQENAKREARTWMAEMEPPSSWAGEELSNSLKPEETLELEFIHG